MVRISTLLSSSAFALLVGGVLLLGRDSFATGKQATAIQILTGFSAKETCSCVFAVQQTDDYCTNFGQQSGYTLTITIDHTGNTVTSAFGAITRTARAGAVGTGCSLDSL
jgi:hypothetical protein